MDNELTSLLKQIEDASLRTKLQKKIETALTPKVSVFSSNAKGVDHIHPNGNTEREANNDITICYEPTVGSRPAKILKDALLRQVSVVNELFDVSETTLNETETTLANSRLVIIILSADALFYPFIPFAFETCSIYQVPVLLLHDLESCFFPNYEGQPQYVIKFFSEKAITFLKDYLSTSIDGIMQRYDETNQQEHEEEGQDNEAGIYSSAHPHKLAEMIVPTGGICDFCSGALSNEACYVCMKCNWGLCGACRKKTEISTKTRAFLSHKRTTAQVIAGRLYEGLTKAGFNVFLDSEAKFKLHDLEKIVQQTDLFVFILSSGIFESVWCLKEVRSALANKKPVIVIRDTNFKIPAKFPEELADIEELIRTSPIYPWVAEYNTQCVDKIIHQHLGAPDELLEFLPIAWNMQKDEVENGVLTITAEEWNQKLVYLVAGLRITIGVDLSTVHTLQLDNSLLINATSFGLDQFPNLKKLVIQPEKDALSLADAAKVIPREAPNIEELILNNQNTALTMMNFFRGLPNLRVIHIAVSRFTADVAEVVASTLQNLEVISFQGSSLLGLEGLRPIGHQIKQLVIDQCIDVDFESIPEIFPNAEFQGNS
eukprot:CAMPEP_0168542912 /NCGR_PEP_ID=MMETSP0413-20121227/1597_1 /TAXON_ID=136452 /ORGANISM="Filamoeba nolandi, Strain NC-AS-23-1" /LENGTH=600 /DNA_ID=CAMNT_0008572813 /DNA_START=20 /DNA_END=1822 /DNA_ORIENTATION=-